MEKRKFQRSKSRDQEANLGRNRVPRKEDVPAPETVEGQDLDQEKSQNGHDQGKGRGGHVQGIEGEVAVDLGTGEDQGQGTTNIRRVSMAGGAETEMRGRARRRSLGITTKKRWGMRVGIRESKRKSTRPWTWRFLTLHKCTLSGTRS